MGATETTRSRHIVASIPTITHDLLLQVEERAMKKVPGAGKNHHRQLLRPRPVQHIAERNHIVFLAVHNQRLFRHVSQRKPADRRRNQHQLPDLHEIQMRPSSSCCTCAQMR